MRVWIALLALPLLLGLSRPAEAEDGGRQGRWGKRNFWRSEEMVEKLALTPEQIEKLEALDDSFDAQRLELRDQARKSREEMKDLLASAEFSQEKAAGLAQIISGQAAERATLDTERLIAIRGTLTAEQWTELESCRERIGERMGERMRQKGRVGRRGRVSPAGEETETTE